LSFGDLVDLIPQPLQVFDDALQEVLGTSRFEGVLTTRKEIDGLGDVSMQKRCQRFYDIARSTTGHRRNRTEVLHVELLQCAF